MSQDNQNLGCNVGKALLIGGGAVAAVATLPILFGFGTAGVAAGSLAAGVQSSIGAVSAGSLFATATSLGMKGYFFGTAVAGGISSGSGAVFNYFTGSKPEDKTGPPK